MHFPIADAHCDFLYGAMEYGYRLDTKTKSQSITLDALKEGNVALQTFACWRDLQLRTPASVQVLTMIDCYYRMLEKEKKLIPFHSEFDPACGKTATLLTIEGGEALEGSVAMLRTYYRLGVRAMTFTWNENNELAGAAAAKRQKGITALGREVLVEMGRIGMALDVSHLSDKGIEDALALGKCSIYASHSNCRALYNCPRSLEDAYIKEIAQRGGVIGINFYGPQLVYGGKASVENIVDHIHHVVSIGGMDCCCIGSDFDGMSVYPEQLPDPSGFPFLAKALLMRGFTQEDTEKICYWNLHRFYSKLV